MKKLLFILLLLPLVLTAQEHKELKSKGSLFLAREGSLIKKELYPVSDMEGAEKIKEAGFTVLSLADLLKKEQMACLQINTAVYSNASKAIEAGVVILDAEEVDTCLDALKYIKENIVNTPPTVGTDCFYTTADFAQIGVSGDAKGEWFTIIKTNKFNNLATVFLKKDALDKLITNLSLAQTKMKELLK